MNLPLAQGPFQKKGGEKSSEATLQELISKAAAGDSQQKWQEKKMGIGTKKKEQKKNPLPQRCPLFQMSTKKKN